MYNISRNDMEGLLTIGGLAREAGVNTQTVRYYERRGLLYPSGRRESGYRVYDEEALKRLLFIIRAKELGFTLKEIKGLLELRVESPTDAVECRKVKEKTREKLKAVEDKIRSLESIGRVLESLLKSCEMRRQTAGCPILDSLEGGKGGKGGKSGKP